MKKLFMLLSLLFLWASSSWGQVSIYSFASSSGTYTPITGGTQLRNGTLTMDSWASTAQTIPSFTFNGVAYTTAYVTSNGILTLGGSAPSSTSTSGISLTVGSGIAICPFSANLDRGTSTASTEMRWETVGDEVVFQWQQMKRYTVTENFDMQVRLNTVNGDINFVYNLNSGPGTSTSYQPQVGIRASASDYKNRLVSTGTEDWSTSLAGTANSNTCRFTSTAPAKNFTSGLTFTWSPPLPCSGSPAPGNTLSTINPACSGINFTLSLQYPTPGTGVTYQWQSSPDGNAPWTNLGTAATQTTSQIVDTWYQCEVTCDGNTAASDPLQVTMNVVSIPYNEGFLTTTIPVCWTTTGWTIGSTRGVTGNPGNNIYKNLYSSAATGTFTTGTIGPVSTGMLLTFDYKLANYSSPYAPPAIGSGNYVVSVSTDGTTFTPLETVANDGVAGWQSKSYNLDAYDGYNINIRLVGNWTSGDWDLAFDNIIVELVPLCFAPSLLNITDITSNSVSINWTPNVNNPSSVFDIYYDLTSTSPTLGTTPTVSTGAGDITYNTGAVLSSNTNYYYWVRSDCGGGTVSSWTSGGSFKTLCDAANIPIIQNFNTVTTPNLPDCWKKKIVSTSSANVTTTSTNHSAPYGVYMSNSGDAASQVYLISPQIVEALNTVRVRYWTYSSGTYPVRIGVMSDPTDALTFEEIASYPTSSTWTERVVDFNSYTGSGTYIAIKFLGTSTYQSVYVDDITIQAIPSCLEPTGINITDLASTSATINWTASVSSPADGYDIYYSTSSTAPDALTTPIGQVLAGEISYQTGSVLTANTTYYAWVRSNCGGGDLSAWAGYTAFYTGYCIPAPSSVDNLGITNVTFSTINNTTVDEPGHYGDYTAMVADVTQGVNTDIYITYTTGYTYGTKIWIDWNNNLIFDDPSELVYTGLSTNVSPTTLAASFTVPGITPIGNYRMRIGGTDADTGPSSPCYTGTFGTFEDYTINVIAASLPEITSLGALSGCVGSSLVINGNNLGGATAVTIGGSAAVIIANTATTVTVTVGIGTTGTVDVTTIAGTATSSETFTIYQLPAAFNMSGGGAYCDGGTGVSITLDGSENGVDYNLSTSPVTTIIGDGNALTFGPSAFAGGIYTITAADATTGCTLAMTGSANVTVDPLPSTLTINPSTASICEGSIQQLDAIGGTIGGSGYIGTGTTGTTTYTPYRGYYGGIKMQNLYEASYLTAIGVSAGTPITEIGYHISAFTGPYTFNGFTIAMKNTSTALLTTTWETGLTTVLAPSNYVLSGTAPFVQMHTLTTPFSWDGTSNLLVETCYNNANGGGVTGNSATVLYTAMTGAHTHYYSADNIADLCGAPAAGSTSTYRPNITLVYQTPVTTTWEPQAGLYTDAVAGTPYTGGQATTVWAMPTANTTYTVIASSAANCTNSGSIEIIVNPIVAPTFTQLGPYFQGATPDALPGTSDNLINGTWSPAVISTATLGTTVYSFTPNVGECATVNTMSIQVDSLPPVHNVTQNTYFNNIQPAIDAANPLGGDVIEVAAGTYTYITEGYPAPSGLIKVTKGVTLKAVPGARPIIDGSGFDGVFKIHPSALLPGNTVIIEGFEIIGNVTTGIAMTMQGCFNVTPAQVIIRDNWFHGMIGGIDFWGAGAYLPVGWTSALANIQITGNKFYDMVTYGTNQGFGVMIEDPANWTTAGNDYAVKIENNEFSNLPSAGVNPGVGIVMTRANDTWEAANVYVAGNSFTSSVPVGVAIMDGDVTNAKIENNSFYNNSVYAILATGIDNGPVTATCNWYGTIVPSAVAALISGPVTYIPYEISDGGACVGGFPVQVVRSGVIISGHTSINDAVNAVTTLAGDEIYVEAGTYVETGQIVITKSLSIIGANSATTIIKPAQNTGNSGDSRGWFLVNSGITFNLSNVTLDGTGKLVWDAILHHGSGTIQNCVFTQIKYNESGPDYRGAGIRKIDAGTVDVTNCNFSQMGRNGVIYINGGTGTASGNTYTGKGTGNWLDYAFDAEYGAVITINDNEISNNLGIATVDGSGSAGVTVWDDPGTGATFTNNTFTNNSIGVAVAMYGGTTPSINIGAGNLFDGGEIGVDLEKLDTQGTPNITFGASTFKNQSVAAIVLQDGISAGSVFDISSVIFKDALNNVITDDFTKEDLIVHAIDAGNRGLLVWNTNNVYVTPNSFATPTTTAPSIQRGIDIASSGWTVNVAAGNYVGNLTVNKSLTIIGDPGDALPGVGLNAPVIDGGLLPGDAFKLANGVTNVTIRGFEMQNFTSPDLDGIGNGISAWVGSTSNITIEDNYFHNLGYNGVLVGNDYSSNPLNWGDHTNWTVQNNIIESFGYIGIELTNTSTSSIEDNIIHLSTPYIGAIFSSARRSETGLTIKDNIIDGTPSALYPVIYMYAYDVDMLNPNLNTVLIEGNTISTIGTPAQIYIRNINTGTVTGVTVINNNLLSLRTNTPTLINAVSNYWGSANGPYNLTSNPCGTVGWVSDNVTFIPWFTDAAMTTLGYPTPAPTGPVTQAYCSSGGKIVSDLTATLTGTDIKWYSAASGGTLYTGTELLVTDSYFASQTVGGCESIDRLEVAVTLTTPVPTISGPATPCKLSTGNSYTTEVGMTAYDWTVSAGGTITAGGDGFDYVSVTWSNPGAESVTVNYTDGNGCTTGTPANIAITVLGPTLTGPATVCKGDPGQTYTTESGKTGYTWVYTGGLKTAGGNGFNYVTLTWTSSGIRSVKVTYTDGACTSQTTYPVTVNKNMPSITGPTTPCQGTVATFNTDAGQTGYDWTISAGGSITGGGDGFDYVDVLWNTAGSQTVTVIYTSMYGCTMTPTVFPVTVAALPVPTLAGPSPVCANSIGNVYTTEAGMTNYIWDISLGGTKTSGGGTGDNTVTITWNTAGPQTVSVGYTRPFVHPIPECSSAIPTVLNVTVNATDTPIFTQIGPYCQGAIADVLPTISNNTNPVTGTWTDGPINTAILGTTVYHFAPDAGQCATTAEMSILVNPIVVPAFFAFAPYQMGSTPPALPGTSNNGISGTWDPSAINTSVAGTFPYTFTPNPGLCAVSTIVNITIYETSLFQVSQDIGTTLFLSWPAVTGAASYAIFYRPLLSPPSGSWVGNSVPYPFIKAVNLTPGTTYECKYIAYKPGGSPVAGGTASGTFTPAHVIFAKSMDIGTTCQVDWNDWSAWASSYVFQYRTGTGSWLPSVRYSPNGKAMNMTPGAPYECRVVVYRNGGLWGTTETWSYVPQPVVFTVGAYTASTCDISWTSMAPWATDRHFYYKAPLDVNWIGLNSYLVDQVSLIGITPGVVYQCKVRAYIPTYWGETAIGTFTVPITKQVSSNEGNNEVSIYPNPFVDQVNMDIFTQEETKVTWNIYDMTGKVVLSGNESVTTGYSTLNIDAAGLSKGVYMFNALINDHLQSFRILKQ